MSKPHLEFDTASNELRFVADKKQWTVGKFTRGNFRSSRGSVTFTGQFIPTLPLHDGAGRVLSRVAEIDWGGLPEALALERKKARQEIVRRLRELYHKLEDGLAALEQE